MIFEGFRDLESISEAKLGFSCFFPLFMNSYLEIVAEPEVIYIANNTKRVPRSFLSPHLATWCLANVSPFITT